MLDPDYFEQKRKQLGLERYDTLQKVQGWLNEHYPDQARAISLNRNVLRLVTASAPVASDLRFRQVEILALTGGEAERLQVQISRR